MIPLVAVISFVLISPSLSLFPSYLCLFWVCICKEKSLEGHILSQ